MREDRERGSGTVLSLFIIAGIAGIAFILASLAAGFDAKHRADSAADFAALAAAQTLHNPGSADAPCAAAEKVVRDVELVDCTVRGSRVVVMTRATVSLGVMNSWTITGQAEAGPE